MTQISDETKNIIRDNAKSKLSGHMIEVAVERELNKHDMDTQEKIEQVETNITQAVTDAIENASSEQAAALNNLADEIKNLVRSVAKT